jgi:hypothetical protein
MPDLLLIVLLATGAVSLTWFLALTIPSKTYPPATYVDALRNRDGKLPYNPLIILKRLDGAIRDNMTRWATGYIADNTLDLAMLVGCVTRGLIIGLACVCCLLGLTWLF